MTALPGLRRPIDAISRWWKSSVTRSSELAELRCCAEDDVERVARDVGVSAPELRRLVRDGPGAADLLYRRMAELDLDRKEVAAVKPRIFQDLQRACALCRHRRQCARDLARDPNGPEWEDYCPNVATLKALDAMPWAARQDW